MKKVLFATTALVATAGVAAADVTFGGYGRFGLQYNEGAVNETSITSRFRLQIDATAESDMGVAFGARARIQQDNDDASAITNIGAASKAPGGAFRGDRLSTGINGVRFFARSGGLEVGVGNIYGALEFMPGQYPIDLGLTGGSYSYTAYGFNGDAYDSDGDGAAGQNGVEVMYRMGDLSVHVSASNTPGNKRTAAHIAYKYNGFTFALGGQDSDALGDTDVTATVGGSFGGANVTFAYADNGTNGDKFVLAGDYAVGAATTLQAYIADSEFAVDTAYGFGVHHDLGGGTSLRAGIENTFAGNTKGDIGVRFNF